MNPLATSRFARRAALATLIAGAILWLFFDRVEENMRAENRDWAGVQKSNWSRDDAARVRVARRKALASQGAHHEERAKLFGGQLDEALKDPTLDLRQMLAQTASACAPIGAAVTVTVERFTEFDVALVLSGPLPVPQLAQISQCLLGHAAPFVHSVRFILGNEVPAQLDWSAIESVTNWSVAKIETIEQLLLAPESALQLDNETITFNTPRPSPAAEKELNPDQKKIRAAELAFTTLFNSHIKTLNELVANLDRERSLDSLQTFAQLQTRLAWLDKLDPYLTAEQEFFLNQPREFDQLLREQELDSLIITILERTRSGRMQADSVLLGNIYGAVTAYKLQIRDFLASMGNHFGEWTADPYTMQIHFTTTAAHDVYAVKSDELIRSLGAVNSRLKEWSAHAAAP